MLGKARRFLTRFSLRFRPGARFRLGAGTGLGLQPLLLGKARRFLTRFFLRFRPGARFRLGAGAGLGLQPLLLGKARRFLTRLFLRFRLCGFRLGAGARFRRPILCRWGLDGPPVDFGGSGTGTMLGNQRIRGNQRTFGRKTAGIFRHIQPGSDGQFAIGQGDGTLRHQRTVTEGVFHPQFTRRPFHTHDTEMPFGIRLPVQAAHTLGGKIGGRVQLLRPGYPIARPLKDVYFLVENLDEFQIPEEAFLILTKRGEAFRHGLAVGLGIIEVEHLPRTVGPGLAPFLHEQA